MSQIMALLKSINGYSWVIGVIAAVGTSWYDLKGSVNDLRSDLKGYKEVQAVKEDKQNFRDQIQDSSIVTLNTEIKEELKSLRQDLKTQKR